MGIEEESILNFIACYYICAHDSYIANDKLTMDGHWSVLVLREANSVKSKSQKVEMLTVYSMCGLTALTMLGRPHCLLH